MRIASKKLGGLALVLAGLACGAAQASSVAIVKDNTVIDNIPGLTNFATLGSQMAGMTVKATFSNGFSETLVWGTTGATSGGVSGTGWNLGLTGDTFTESWNFGFLGPAGALGQLVQLVLDGLPGLTVFDTSLPDTGTPGSSNGRDFEFFDGSCDSCSATATYTRGVAVIPDDIVGDIFHQLTVDFGQTGPRTAFAFRQDTDNDSRITVPEPGSLALAGLAIVALLGAGAKRRKA
jgi:hypothetical protein